MAIKKTTTKKSCKVTLTINGAGEFEGKSEYSQGLRLTQARALGEALAQAVGDWSCNMLDGVTNKAARRGIIDRMVAGFAKGLKSLAR